MVQIPVIASVARGVRSRYTARQKLPSVWEFHADL
jgi:hypothetical protein